MICPRCRTDNTRCVDDMLTIGYVAEIYECNTCHGTIEVEYEDDRISYETIKTYKYIAAPRRECKKAGIALRRLQNDQKRK